MINFVQLTYKALLSKDASLPLIALRLLGTSVAHVIALNPYCFLSKEYNEAASQYSISKRLEELSKSSKPWYHVSQAYHILYNALSFSTIDHLLKYGVRDPIASEMQNYEQVASISTIGGSYLIMRYILRNYTNCLHEEHGRILNRLNSSIVSSKYHYFHSADAPALLVAKSVFCLTDVFLHKNLSNNQDKATTAQIIAKHAILCTTSLGLMYIGLNQDNFKCHLIKTVITKIVAQYGVDKSLADLVDQAFISPEKDEPQNKHSFSHRVKSLLLKFTNPSDTIAANK